jgi:hypothetical protein
MQKAWVVSGIVLAASLLVVWIVASAKPSPARAFKRYVYAPLPQSVQNIVFEGKDPFGLKPECRCFLTFNISPGDVARIVNEKGFVSRPNTWGQWGPDWFKPPTRGVLFLRNISRSLLRFPPRWDQSEYFWIDETGTNGFFMVWRYD